MSKYDNAPVGSNYLNPESTPYTLVRVAIEDWKGEWFNRHTVVSAGIMNTYEGAEDLIQALERCGLLMSRKTSVGHRYKVTAHGVRAFNQARRQQATVNPRGTAAPVPEAKRQAQEPVRLSWNEYTQVSGMGRHHLRVLSELADDYRQKCIAAAEAATQMDLPNATVYRQVAEAYRDAFYQASHKTARVEYLPADRGLAFTLVKQD